MMILVLQLLINSPIQQYLPKDRKIWTFNKKKDIKRQRKENRLWNKRIGSLRIFFLLDQNDYYFR